MSRDGPNCLAAMASENTHILRKYGSSVRNLVVAASSLGAKTFFSGKVAADSDTQLYVDDLVVRYLRYWG